MIVIYWYTNIRIHTKYLTKCSQLFLWMKENKKEKTNTTDLCIEHHCTHDLSILHANPEIIQGLLVVLMCPMLVLLYLVLKPYRIKCYCLKNQMLKWHLSVYLLEANGIICLYITRRSCQNHMIFLINIAYNDLMTGR